MPTTFSGGVPGIGVNGARDPIAFTGPPIYMVEESASEDPHNCFRNKLPIESARDDVCKSNNPVGQGTGGIGLDTGGAGGGDALGAFTGISRLLKTRAKTGHNKMLDLSGQFAAKPFNIML